MRGYFTRLAKQSGIAIGGRSPHARSRASSTLPPRLDRADAPLHVEIVDLVNPSPADEGHQDASESGRRPTPEINDMKGFAGETKQAKQHVPPGDAVERSIAAPSAASSYVSDQQTLELSETKLIGPASSRSFTLESTPVGQGSEVDESASEKSEQHSGRAGGVVRVRESGSAIQPGVASDPYPATEVARAIERLEPNSSMPPEYLAGIGEWLSSTPENIEPIQSRSAVDSNLQNAFGPPDQELQSLVPGVGDRDGASQADLQEFNLSIGNISIIVEQPTQPPKEKPATRQPAERQSFSAQRSARDGFALSRSYFRGF